MRHYPVVCRKIGSVIYFRGSGPDRRQGRPADRLNQRFAISKTGMEAD